MRKTATKPRRHRPSRPTTGTGATPVPVAGRGSTATTWSPPRSTSWCGTGPAALTMRRLATELDVGTPTIYWHVGSRDELVAAIVRTQSERLAERPVAGRDRPGSGVLRRRSTSTPGRSSTGPSRRWRTRRAWTRCCCTTSRPRSSPSSRPRAWSARRAPTRVRAILVVVTGALVLALRDPSRFPEAYRSDALWAGSDAPVAPDTRTALQRRSRPRRPDRRHPAGGRRPPRARAGRTGPSDRGAQRR